MKSMLKMAQLGKAAEGADVFLFYSRFLVCPVVSLSSLLSLNLYLYFFFLLLTPIFFFFLNAVTCGGLGEQCCRNIELLREM